MLKNRQYYVQNKFDLYKCDFFVDKIHVLLYNTYKSDCMTTYNLMSI